MSRPLLIALTLLAACDRGVNCTTEARSSVSLTLVGEGGRAIPGADVTYTVDGGAPQPCEEITDGDYVCGWEVEGSLTITAAQVGYVTETFTVEVDADECHVITEVVTRTLEGLDCTDEALPGVVVHVTDTQGQEITAATVTWAIPDAELAPAACESLGGNTWACAEEHAGSVEVAITDAGPYEPYVTTVEVEHDGCHPITETLDAVLVYLPD